MTRNGPFVFGLLPLIVIFAASRPAEAHGHSAPILDESALDQGLYVAVKHPHVVRDPGSFDVRVIVGNVAGSGEVIVQELRYVLQGPQPAATHRPRRLLESRAVAFGRYQAVRALLGEAVQRHDRAAVQELAAPSRAFLSRIASGMFVDRFRIDGGAMPRGPGASLHLSVEIDVVQGGRGRTIARAVAIPLRSPLPTGAASDMTGAWHAGDQHLHTTYSLDALVLNGTTENVTDYAASAELIGLDWIIVTDHSNVHVNWLGVDYYTPEQFDEGTAQAAAYTAQHDFLALYGQEMGLGSYGFFNLPAHMLALPWQSDSTGYLANPSSGLIFGLANCEGEQVIIDRISAAGGLGFIAHPFDSGDLAYVQWNWDNNAAGWAGLEIFSDTDGVFKNTDQQALDKWHELLTEIAAPANCQLADRPDYPTDFPVGLGNSDAHEPGLIGRTFTYAHLPGAVTRQAVAQALVEGRCVASNGPLVFGAINGAGTGDVALLWAISNEMELTLQTTPEFGPVGDYQLTVFVDGAPRTVLGPSGSPALEMTITVNDLALAPPDTFVTIRADSIDGAWHAIANPIWLQFTCAADVNLDGAVNVLDLLAVLAAWGAPGGPEDINGDGVVDVLDLLEVLAAWGPC